ncbi:dynamin family protein [Pimelobacter simplex]|uniref:Putative ATP-binding protein n=1 Tax=Nocardioides simplex TaxID=2045 RepID=A0A0A1DTB7_NOCSI|nr:dynamin family protein [Pimelobacter simplex]AIY19798.2 putative ATP-binding protein [Pimelobacter simplex]GEB12618.1 ABC transporter [Pimelobacter simplex]SFM56862.1 Dynamin family protein [Pimelobacter simplex]
MTPGHQATTGADLLDDVGGRMLTEVVRLHGSLNNAPLPLDLPSVDALRVGREHIIEQLEDYIIPRLTEIEAPLLVVVGGSTGAGKSTLVNTLVGTKVTTPGLLRPTTRSPVLVHHPDDGRWFGADRLLPELARVAQATTDQDAIQLVPSLEVPRGLAILDAPDVDSVDERNRELASQLLAAADLWLFVTSAARYSDQVPWDHLKQAVDRNTAVALVLSRTSPDDVSTVSVHLARMMAARGLKDSPLFAVPQGPVSDDGLLPTSYGAEIKSWLDALAADTAAKRDVVNQTVAGAVRTVTRKAFPIADAVDQQVEAVADLLARADRVYDEAQAALLAAGSDGTLLRGDLLARWQEFVGSGELVRTLEAKVGFVRERLVNAIKGKPQQAERVGLAIEMALETLVADHAERAASTAAAAWREKSYGEALLRSTTDDLSRAGRGLRAQAEQEIRAWHDELQELVRTEAGDARHSARFLALGVRGLAVTLGVVALAGPQPHADAAEAVRLGEGLLATTLGQAGADRVVDQARGTLARRLATLMGAERARYLAPAAQWQLKPDAPDQLRQAARRVDDLRFAAAKKGTGGHL